MTTPDPFDRAVQREQAIRRRAAVLDSPAGFMRLAFRFVAAAGIGWTVLLALHWLLFPDPRWLAVAHTVVFALTAGYYLLGAAFVVTVKKRRPDWFERN